MYPTVHTKGTRRFLVIWSKGSYGVTFWNWHVRIRRLSEFRPLFSERNKISVKYITIGDWRLTIRKLHWPNG